MKKEMIMRGLLGFPLGMALGEAIAIAGSLIWGGGYYAPCTPQFVQAVGSESHAVALQAFLCGLIGAICAMASVILEIRRWSIVKRVGVYFLVTAAVMMPIAYITGWMEHSLSGAVKYLGIFAGLLFSIWGINYAVCRYNVKKMNDTLHGR